MRKHLLILIATVALAGSSAGAAGAVSSSTGPGAVAGAAAVSGGTVSASSKQKARSKALRKCRKIKKKAKRKRCIRRVKKRFSAPRASAQGPIAAQIDVRDKYFSPAVVSIKTGQSILWVWNAINADAHNVDLIEPTPPGVKRIEFSTPSSPSVGFQFRRTFTVPGMYNFVCSIHYLMTMRVEVSK